MDELKIAGFKKQIILAKYFCYLPYIRAIFLTGSISRGGQNSNSDIDLIIIANSNRLYLAKFILHGLLRILNLIQTSQKKAGRYSLEDFWDIKYFNSSKLNLGLISSCKDLNYLKNMTAVYNQHAAKRLETAIYLNSRKFKFPKLQIITVFDNLLQNYLKKHYAKDSRRNNSNYHVILEKNRIVIHPNDQILDETIYA